MLAVNGEEQVQGTRAISCVPDDVGGMELTAERLVLRGEGWQEFPLTEHSRSRLESCRLSAITDMTAALSWYH